MIRRTHAYGVHRQERTLTMLEGFVVPSSGGGEGAYEHKILFTPGGSIDARTLRLFVVNGDTSRNKFTRRHEYIGHTAETVDFFSRDVRGTLRDGEGTPVLNLSPGTFSYAGFKFVDSVSDERFRLSVYLVPNPDMP